MIVIGVDVHKHSLTAVAVDELGRALGEHSGAADGDELVAWACSLGEKRLWALEDCRHVTRALSGGCSRAVSGWCGCRRG
jgi:transposase